MGFPRFRFTLNNTVAGSLQISEPGGWDESVLKLERNQEYHSLVEFFDQPLMFYGQNSEGNGGLDYIRAVEESQGPDAQITILIEITFDEGTTYTTIFNGLIDITSCKEIDFYKAEYGIIRDDFWQKFMNRKGISVDLGSSTDLDGNAITPTSPDTLTLVSQKIQLNFERQTPYDQPFEGTGTEAVGTTSYLIWGNPNTVVDEITERFEYGTQISSVDPLDDRKCIFKVAYGGDYTFDFSIKYIILLDASRTYDVRWYYSHRSADGTVTTTQIGSTDSGSSGSIVQTTAKTATPTLSLEAGDEVYVYGVMLLNSATGAAYAPDFEYPGIGDYNFTDFSVEGNTTYENTTVGAFQIYDAANAIVSKLVGVNTPIASDYLSADYGCGGNYALTKGLNIRGYSLSAKPMFMTFDTWWNGINPILNLGLGYIRDQDVIEIEKKEDFYDPSPSIYLDFVNNIERSYSSDHIFKSIEIGFEKWSAESGSGMDDPQSKRTFRTRFKTVGKDLKLMSKFYAASLGIEQTRRNRIELGKDWRLDEDVFILALKRVNPLIPETGSDFSSVTGLLNSSTRYNIRISPARNLQRWLNYIAGCLNWYTENDDLTFSGGEGNYDMVSTLSSNDCEGTDLPIDENGAVDLGAGNDFLFQPIIYSFEYPLTWDEYETIRNNRKKAIGISRSNSGYSAVFILTLEYHLTRGKADFTVILGQPPIDAPDLEGSYSYGYSQGYY